MNECVKIIENKNDAKVNFWAKKLHFYYNHVWKVVIFLKKVLYPLKMKPCEYLQSTCTHIASSL